MQNNEQPLLLFYSSMVVSSSLLQLTFNPILSNFGEELNRKSIDFNS